MFTVFAIIFNVGTTEVYSFSEVVLFSDLNQHINYDFLGKYTNSFSNFELKFCIMTYCTFSLSFYKIINKNVPVSY